MLNRRNILKGLATLPFLGFLRATEAVASFGIVEEKKQPDLKNGITISIDFYNEEGKKLTYGRAVTFNSIGNEKVSQGLDKADVINTTLNTWGKMLPITFNKYKNGPKMLKHMGAL